MMSFRTNKSKKDTETYYKGWRWRTGGYPVLADLTPRILESPLYPTLKKYWYEGSSFRLHWKNETSKELTVPGYKTQ